MKVRERLLSVRGGPPEWLRMRGLSVFRPPARGGERWEQKHLSRGQVGSKNTALDECQGTPLRIRYHRSGFSACLER